MENQRTFPSSFGGLLKTFRKRQRLTQKRLAQQLSVHANTVSSWELGTYLPATRGLVLELARCLLLDESEARQLLEASLTTLFPQWGVPYPRNLFFTGREEILEALHRQLGVDQAVALTQSSALHGLGGVGKTQLALEYAYRYALEYSAVFWIEAETVESIVSSLLRVAEMLQLPERDDKDQQRVIAAVQQWLMTHNQWLLIWDNVEDLALLDRSLPPARRGTILLTTRIQALGTVARGIDLLPMEHEEGMLFLLRRAKVLQPEARCEQMRQLAVQMPPLYAAAADLVSAMGGLPLALDQAGAYIEETQCDLPAYLELFRVQHGALLQQRGDGSRDHPESVSTTFTLAITATARRHPAVWDLLRVCALLHPDAIPEELFRRGYAHFGAPLEGICRDALGWNRMVACACSYSLLSRQAEAQTLSMHRLVQAVLLDSMTEAERRQWSALAIQALDAVFPEVLLVTEYAGWKQAERLLPHVLACLSLARAASESSILASLAHKAAQYLRERGQYAQAEPLYQRALQIREEVLGSGHSLVASSLNALAILSREQGRYAEAEPLYRRALRIQEQVLGPDHPEIASSLNSLAALYWSQGKYDQAERLLQRASHIWEQALGPDHPEVVRPLNNLGLIYGMQGKYDQAEPLLQRALHVWEKALGPDHPLVADALHNLAELSRDQGKYAQAEALFLRVLRIREQALGPDHPLGASALHDLAAVYLMQDKYVEAEPLYRRALQIREKALGPDHPLVAEPLNGLANLSRDQGYYAEAEQLYRRARAIREQQLGQQHPETAQTLHDLAIFQRKQDNLCEALSLVECALRVRTQTLGEVHPQTVASRTLHTQLVQEQGELEADERREPCMEEIPARVWVPAAPALQVPTTAASSEDCPLRGFLDACCELHPRARSRASDLWQEYACWVRDHHERFPLSRRAFAAQLKAHGCRADRTNSARIWHGITLVKNEV